MRTLVTAWLAALAIGATPSMAADDGPAGQRPGPEQLFQRLDADHDGQLVPDEFPPRMKERLGAVLERSDTNGDKKLSREEFVAAIQARRPGAPEAGRGGPRRPGARGARPEGPPRQPGPPEAGRGGPRRPGVRGARPEGFPRQPGPPEAGRGGPPRRPLPPAAGWQGPPRRFGPPPWAMARGLGRPFGPPAWVGRGFPRGRGMQVYWGGRGRPRGRAMAPWARGRMERPGPPPGVAGPRQLPDLKAVFIQFDKDKDKKLSLEEFTAAVRSFHRQPPLQGPSAAPAMGGPRLLLERFKAADKNKDGKLSKDEAPGPLKERFEKVDADKDGFLEPEELRRAAMILRRSRPADTLGPKIRRPLPGQPDALRPLRPAPPEMRPPGIKPIKPAIKPIKPPIKPQVLKPRVRKPDLKQPIERNPEPKE